MPDISRMEPITTGIVAYQIGKAGARLLERALGRAADEYGDFLAGKVRELSARRGRVLDRAGRALEGVGVEGIEIPIKLLAPIIEKAGLEEDEDLSERWSALLANAAHPGRAKFVLPIFPHILSLLTPQDARVLDQIAKFQKDIAAGQVITRRPWVDRKSIGETSGLSGEETELAVGSLLGHGLIERQGPMDTYQSDIGEQPFVVLTDEEGIATTPLGDGFLRACQMPR